MKKTIVLLAGFITLLTATYVSADPLLKQGTSDLSLAGSPDFTAPTGDTLSLGFGYGLFLRDNLVLRGVLQHDVQEDIATGGSDYRATEYGLVVEYHFDFGWSTVPYVGADLGWRRSKFASIRDDGIIYGPRVGVKYFITDNIAIDAAVSYKLADTDLYISDFEFENKKIFFGFGLRVMF